MYGTVLGPGVMVIDGRGIAWHAPDVGVWVDDLEVTGCPLCSIVDGWALSIDGRGSGTPTLFHGRVTLRHRATGATIGRGAGTAGRANRDTGAGGPNMSGVLESVDAAELDTALRRVLAVPDPSRPGTTRAEAVAWALVDLAMSGHYQAVREILSRVDGPMRVGECER